ncbi:hypothetical protein [Pseudoclavibacter sp. Z016]|uniref:aspartate racemase/maleate isomerase family protein n=1 Tax=Pseudoclavibacter sp. Z016 TaxID=2080581 RepID=UPI0011B02932|nr:hypothetical protein [Pseudoclavibacter sp. Z016]
MLVFDLLYPTPDSGEDDFVELARRSVPPAQVRPTYFPWPTDVEDLATLGTADRYDAVRRLGSEEHLRAVLPPLMGAETRPNVSMFGVTSASFMQGRDGAADQLRTLAEITGVPVTSTTVAFQRALVHLGISRVSLASIYHPIGSDHFVDRLRDAEVRAVGRVDVDAGSRLSVLSNQGDNSTR